VLPPVPAAFARSRDGLHALAFYVISPARRVRTGHIGLQWSPGGFGTPVFDGRQIRVEGTDLVVETEQGTHRASISTLAAAGDLIGYAPNPADKHDFDVLDMPPPYEPLGVTADAVALVDAWFGLGAAALDELRAAETTGDSTAPTLWPEHFDLAIELGDEARVERATYGVSPGDADHPEPYAYVSAWRDVDRRDPYWNDRSFSGATIAYADVAAATEPRAELVEFFRHGVRALSGPPRR